MALVRIRDEFPILERRNYLNSCSLGALSRRAEAALHEFAARWHDQGAAAWYEHWWSLLADLRRRVEKMFAAPAGSVALLPTTSTCLSVIAESLDWSKRNRIVATELDFPTLLYQWRVRPGAELVVLESSDGVRVDLEQFERAVDERTLAVATSHVFFSTGAVQDLGALSRIARKAGAWCIVDGYQGAGQVPVNLPATGVDFYTAGPLKWLCGGPGLAYLYVRRELVDRLAPRITSWFAADDPFGFDPAAFRYREDARRFEMGTPALPTVHTALAGQEIVDEVGVPAIRAMNQELAERAADGCRAAGFSLRMADDRETASAIVAVRHPSPEDAVRRLAARRVVVDHRPGVVRASPHFYNTADEVDDFVAALAATLP